MEFLRDSPKIGDYIKIKSRSTINKSWHGVVVKISSYLPDSELFVLRARLVTDTSIWLSLQEGEIQKLNKLEQQYYKVMYG